MANFHNVKMSAKSADTLRDTSIYFKLSPQFSPSVLAGFRPVGCDIFLDVASLLANVIATPLLAALSGPLQGLYPPIEKNPFSKVGDKWKSTHLTKLQIREWNRDFIGIELEGSGNIPLN
jgi:hypothetical protein